MAGDDINESKPDRHSVLTPTVVRLGLISFFADLSSEMLYPVTPIFLTAVLGSSMLGVGLIEGVAEAIASLLKTFSGAWSDRLRRRKPFVSIGYLLAALAKPLIGSAGNWTHVLFARALDRTGKGLRSAPRDALLAESVHTSVRGAAFGWHRAFDTFGAAIGPLLAIVWLAWDRENLRGLFYVAVVPGLIAFAITLTLRESSERSLPKEEAEPLQPQSEAQPQPQSQPPPRTWLTSLPPPLIKFLIAWLPFSLANSSDAFLLLRAQQLGAGLIETILMYCFYNLVYALASPVLGGLSDRLGKKRVLIVGLFVFSLVYFGFVWVTTTMGLWILFGTYGLYMAATDGVGKAFAIELVGEKDKGLGVGAMGTLTGLSTLVASATAGWLWDTRGGWAAFLFGSAGAALSGLLLVLWVRSDGASQGPPEPAN